MGEAVKYFPPEQKAELDSFSAPPGEKLAKMFAEIDAVIAKLVAKYPRLAHLLDSGL